MAQVQPWSLRRCPFLLCRLAEDAGLEAPNPGLLFEADQCVLDRVCAEIRQSLVETMRGIKVSACSAHTLDRPTPPGPARARPNQPPSPRSAPSASSTSSPGPGRAGPAARYAHAVDAEGVRFQQQSGRILTRAARARRFVKPWWIEWKEDLARVGAMVGARDARAADVNAARLRLFGGASTSITQGGVVPEELRPALWICLARRGEVSRFSPSWYRSLCTCGTPGSPEEARTGEVRNQILRDLERTPGLLFVGGASGSGGRSEAAAERLAAARTLAAERLLMAYSQHMPSIGYCQGLNFVAATLLSVLDEQSAFVVFCGLIERLPVDLYSCDPERLARRRTIEQDRFSSMLAAERPRLAAHFGALDLDLNLFLPRWLTCLFASVLPPPATLRLWDFVLGAEGGRALPRLALAILLRAEEPLLSATDVKEALGVLSATVDAVVPSDVDRMLRHEFPAKRLARYFADTEDDELYGELADSVTTQDGWDDRSTEASTFVTTDDMM